MNRRAAIYARQSITREGSASLETQVEVCRDAANRLKARVVAELVEAPSTSGYRNRGRNRPKFGELLELIRSGQVDCVIAYKTDRLSRGGGPGWAPLVDAFEAAGRDPDRAVATADGWVSEFEIGIRSAMDREESKKTSDRMLAVRAREAKEGIPRIAGRRPYGFTSDMTKHIPEELERVREAADRVLLGESMWSICSDWMTRGVPTVTGRPWTVTTLTSILTSGRMAGLREHKGVVVAKGQWEPVWSEEMRDALVQTLSPKRTRPRRGRTYPLTGLLRCGLCGAPLRSLAREGGGRSYACRKGPGLNGCGRIRIKADGVEEYVRDLICGMLADPVTREALAAFDEPATECSSIGVELANLKAKRERLVDLYTEGEIDRDCFRRRCSELDAEVRELEHLRRRPIGVGWDATIPHSFEELVALWTERGIAFQRELIEAVLLPTTVHPCGTRRRCFDPERLEIEPRA